MIGSKLTIKLFEQNAELAQSHLFVLKKLILISCYSKIRKSSRNDHLLSFVVTHGAARCHSLHHALSLDVSLTCLFKNDPLRVCSRLNVFYCTILSVCQFY